jgi:hypothetical protein
MEILRNVLLVLHIVGFAGIIGGVLMEMPKVKQGLAKINGAILHSSWLMLATGLGLVAMMYAMDREPDNAKIGVKTIVVLAIVVLALINKKKTSVSAGVLGTIGGLAVLNVVLAVMW